MIRATVLRIQKRMSTNDCRSLRALMA